jgi:predicted ester cyclase
MVTEETRALATRYMDLLDQHDLNGVVELCAPGCAFHGFGPQPLDRQGFVQTMSAYFAAFPDARFPVDDLIVEGDRAANRHRMVATHSGVFQGIPPTGMRVTVQGMDVVHCAQGLVQEFWLNADIFGLLQQLGVIPQP